MKVRINPDKCIACATCVAHCPVASATPKYLGPRMIGPAYERFRLMALGEDPSLTYCSNCKNCDITCPQGVQVSDINMLARADHVRKHGAGLRDWVLAHGELQSKLLSIIPAPLKNWGMLNPLTRLCLDKLGIDKRAPLPAFAKKTFRSLLKDVKQPDLKKTVVFFPGCFVDVYDPQTGLDMVWAFNRAGYKVVSPDGFVCCGLPMVANGFWDDAKSRAQKNLAVLKEWESSGAKAVTGCPSCALTFRQEMPEYFPDLEEKYGNLRVEDAQDFLMECVKNGELDLTEKEGQKPYKIIYHTPCHLRVQGDGLPGLELLRLLPGVKAEAANAGCCGISGSYGFKKEKYEIGMEIGAELFEKIKLSGADVGVSECGTCRVQMEHGSGKRAVHPVSVLKWRIEGVADK